MASKALPIVLGGLAAAAIIFAIVLNKSSADSDGTDGTGETSEYPCPYCDETFATYEELVAHVQSDHPGERIPIIIDWEGTSGRIASQVLPPGAAVEAIAPVLVSPAGIEVIGELFIGPDDQTKVASSGEIAFTSSGAEQTVRFPITMPSPGGEAYHVYLDFSTGGIRFLSFIAEDVIIPAGEVGPVTWE